MSPEFEAFYQNMLSKPVIQEPTLQQMRERFDTIMSSFTLASDIAVDPVSIGERKAYWFRAPNASKDRTILFFHGGGFIVGSPSDLGHQELAGRISRATGASVLAASYRLAPEYPFPAQLEDAIAAYEYVQKMPSQLVVGGMSAGGGLALSLLLSLKKQKLPLGSFLLSPWVDLAMLGQTIKTNDGKDSITRKRLEITRDLALQGHNPKDPLASPLYGDLSGLPPFLLQVGTREILYSEDLQFAEKARNSGVDVTLSIHDGMVHSWQLYSPHFPEADQAIDEVGTYVKGLFSS